VLIKNLHIFAYIFQNDKVFNSFILSFAWICIRKGKLMGCTFTTINVLDNINLDKILKSDIRYNNLRQIKTSLDYLDRIF
jgi:hypothetical protein